MEKLKQRFIIEIAGKQLTTYAYNTSQAITNCSYRYAKEEEIAVGLVIWKIKNGDIGVVVIDEP